ncbi:Hypothetical predicted protein [Lecanosticta acicola]|uniref:Uncharacterized protein n=1 Tax=Lecanosticta acicola TaxID=111012 RepID=A0AAI9EAY2_9PEZI|nr:Hypothetical predicted protein [Lecanosticta acicola]
MFTQAASSALAIGLFALRASAGAADASWPQCSSYGVDFQSGGTYFQNISSADDFTFTSMFENCQDDSASNILVDPNGDEYECSGVPLQPDDTNEVSTCPLQKDQMWSGDWSVLILSNNGDAEPIAYERDFSLIVGTPTTITYTPTITATITSTPLTTSTLLSTTTSTSTVTVSITRPAQTRKPTTTITPSAVTSTKVWTVGWIKTTAFVVSPVVQTSTIPQTCSFSTQPTADPTLTWRPSLLPASLAHSFTADSASASASPSPSASATWTSAAASTTERASRRCDNPVMRRVPADRTRRIAERKARLAEAGLEKRGLDAATTTVTDTNTADYVTSTSTITAPVSTVSVTSVVTSTTTLTSTTTILAGTTTLAPSFVTLPTPTKTSLRLTVVTQTVATVTKRPNYTICQHTAPAASTSVCTVKGGRMVD